MGDVMASTLALRPSLHEDTFSRENLPPSDEWPQLSFDLPGLQFPDQLNCASWLLDRALGNTDPSKIVIFHDNRKLSYAELASMTNRIARTLVEELGVVSGSRVLLHGPNAPELFAAWLAIVKAGAIVVSTMPMLRSRELLPIIEKAQISLALCAQECFGELEPLVGNCTLNRVVRFGDSSCELNRLMAQKSDQFAAVLASQDDVCLIAFTSGTTGEPKATMHFHRDVLAMCHTFAQQIIPAGPSAIFTGSPPVGFTFGLGALLVFPIYFCASIALPKVSTPAGLMAAVQELRATHIFTAPTAYKKMCLKLRDYDHSSLQVCVSAGEALPKSTSDAWFDATKIRIIDGIGSTEMMHIFISSTMDQVRPGATGKPVSGYRACLIDNRGRHIDGAGIGRLGVQGPTGCRYLKDIRQKDHVIDGWNMTGDLYRRDADGYYWYIARIDDMIVSSGYNISGPEVEAAMALHPDVQECAVIGWPDEERGQIVKAVVVPREGVTGGSELVRALQEHMKRTLAPYKYPRTVEFRTALPKTQTGKIMRSALRNSANENVRGHLVNPTFLEANMLARGAAPNETHGRSELG
jgi:2-aminobenzoate-CoA ligase